jgi:predicted phage terminase large subunit-like protein
VRIPAILDAEYLKTLPKKYGDLIKPSETVNGRFSYWPEKQPLQGLLKMERGDGKDEKGNRVSRYVYASQYDQRPTVLGGNVIHGKDFVRYKVAPRIVWRKIYVDTAQKTSERNDFSVFEEWGYGEDGKIYLLDLIRNRWESPELRRTAIAFWAKHKPRDVFKFGTLRKLMVEDKSSGTDLIQTLKLAPHNLPIEAIERTKDKLTRVMDALPYIESGQVCIPEDAPFTSDFVSECEAFTADDSHDHDDQVDPLCDAIQDMLASGNILKIWAAAGK